MARDWVNTVKGLLANANDPRLDQKTRDIYMDRATAVMASKRINEAMLSEGEREEIRSLPFHFVPPLTETAAEFLAAIGDALDCRVLIIGDPSEVPTLSETFPKGSLAVFLIGYDSDVEQVKIINDLTFAQAITECVASPIPDNPREAAVYVHSFLCGYSDTVAAKIRQAYRKAADELPGTGLALLDKASKVDNFLADQYGSYNKEVVTLTDARAHIMGRMAGSQADIGQTRVSDPQEKPLVIRGAISQ